MTVQPQMLWDITSVAVLLFNRTPQAYRLKGGACGTILIQMHRAHLNSEVLHVLHFSEFVFK